MATTLPATEAILKSFFTEEVMMARLGYVRVEGLSFWVRPIQPWYWWGRECDRPFTKKQHRAHQRKQFKLRWIGRFREIKRRAGNAGDALRGREDEGYYW